MGLLYGRHTHIHTHIHTADEGTVRHIVQDSYLYNTRIHTYNHTFGLYSLYLTFTYERMYVSMHVFIISIEHQSCQQNLTFMYISGLFAECVQYVCIYKCMYVLCLFPGGFSASQWSARQYLPESNVALGSKPSSSDDNKVAAECSASTIAAATTTTTTTTSSAGQVATRRQKYVFENRDLCRIICCFIPTINIQ